MNYLAHLLLAGDDPQWQLGGMLGDHVRGWSWQDYPSPIAAGILLHRAIDRTTDAHPAVRNARSRLPQRHRRYGGIILDLFFDHLLAEQWVRYHDQPLDAFATRIYRLLRAERQRLPASLVRLGDYLEHHNMLVNYAEPDYLALALSGVSKRLSRANPLAESVHLLADDKATLQQDFDRLMADLVSFADAHRAVVAARVMESR